MFQYITHFYYNKINFETKNQCFLTVLSVGVTDDRYCCFETLK